MVCILMSLTVEMGDRLKAESISFLSVIPKAQ